jgi:hypothetical protein
MAKLRAGKLGSPHRAATGAIELGLTAAADGLPGVRPAGPLGPLEHPASTSMKTSEQTNTRDWGRGTIAFPHIRW